jgi:hypothetical protein
VSRTGPVDRGNQTGDTDKKKKKSKKTLDRLIFRVYDTTRFQGEFPNPSWTETGLNEHVLFRERVFKEV